MMFYTKIFTFRVNRGVFESTMTIFYIAPFAHVLSRSVLANCDSSKPISVVYRNLEKDRELYETGTVLENLCYSIQVAGRHRRNVLPLMEANPAVSRNL
jgi:hypothetical protein